MRYVRNRTVHRKSSTTGAYFVFKIVDLPIANPADDQNIGLEKSHTPPVKPKSTAFSAASIASIEIMLIPVAVPREDLQVIESLPQ